MEELLISVIGWARGPHSRFSATLYLHWMRHLTGCCHQDGVRLLCQPGGRTPCFPGMKSASRPPAKPVLMAKGQEQPMAGAAWHWEAVWIKPLRPASKREASAVPAVFHLTRAQQAPSPGTAVGRGRQRTPAPPRQAPLVGLEQGAAWGQNHTRQLSSCKTTN